MDVPRDELTDEELTAEALAADPDAHVPDDAIALDVGDAGSHAILPAWYMPAPSAGHNLSRGRRVVFTVLAASLIAGNVAGFCVTFGFPEFLWG